MGQRRQCRWAASPYSARRGQSVQKEPLRERSDDLPYGSPVSIRRSSQGAKALLRTLCLHTGQAESAIPS